MDNPTAPAAPEALPEVRCGVLAVFDAAEERPRPVIRTGKRLFGYFRSIKSDIPPEEG